MTAEDQYKEYISLHKDFSETYSRVYKYVMDFYPQPQKFIHDASAEMEGLAEKLNHPEYTGEQPMDEFVNFAYHFKSFAADTNDIFEEYKGLYGESGNYIKTIFKLKESEQTPSNEYIDLIPVLNKLVDGFQHIKQRTDLAASNLKKLQTEWSSLKEKIDPGKSTAWPL